MPLPFSEIKNSSIKRVATFCATSADFATLINDCTRELLRRGDWANTVTPIFVCVTNGCLVWPRYVGQVRRLNVCNQPVPVRNMWYEFLPGTKEGCGQWHSWIGNSASLTNQGRTSVFQDIQGDGRLVRAYARCNDDFGKTVRIYGTDNNGQPLQTVNADGSITMGQTLVLGSPFASTTTFVRSIDYVLKDVTECMVDLYAYNATTNLLEELAHYDPGDTSPSFERTRLNVAWSNPCLASATPNCCGVVRGVIALVKLKFIPVVGDDDLCIIDNLDALKLMVQAIKFQEAGDAKNYLEYRTLAVEELNRGLEDMSPDNEVAVANNVLGPHTWANQCF